MKVIKGGSASLVVGEVICFLSLKKKKKAVVSTERVEYLKKVTVEWSFAL